MEIIKFRYKTTFAHAVFLLLVPLTGCAQIRATVESTEAVMIDTVSPTMTASRTMPAPTRTETVEIQPVSRLGVDASDLRGETVQFWHTWSGEAGEVVAEHIKKFNQNNEWGIEVQPMYLGSFDTLSSEVVRALQGGESPDLVVAYLHQAQAWEQEGRIADLTPYVEDPVWGFSLEEQQDFLPVFWGHDVSSGKRFGIPAQRSGMLMFYNSTWAEELGFNQLPETPESLKEQVCTSARAYLLDEDTENDGMGGMIVTSDYAAILSWIYAFGGDIANPESEFSEQSGYDFNNEEVAEALTFLRELYDQGCAWKAESQTNEFAFANRQGLITVGSLLDIPVQKEAFREARNRDSWTVLPFPSPESQPTFDAYGPSFVLFSSTPEKELAGWLFTKWLSEPEQQIKLVEASGAFPLRQSTLDGLDDYAKGNPQWSAAVERLSSAKPESNHPSWGVVRWALGDAARQLFMYYFSIEQIPELLEFLDQTAFELYLGPARSGLLDTPTFTPSPSATMTVTPTASQTATITPTASRTATVSASSTISPSPTLSPLVTSIP